MNNETVFAEDVTIDVAEADAQQSNIVNETAENSAASVEQFETVESPATESTGEHVELHAEAVTEAPEIERSEEPVRPTILIVHASVGSGHKSAANSIANAFELLRDDPKEAEEQGISVPQDLNVEVHDILDFGRHKFDGDTTASMFTGFTRPYYDLTWRYTFTGRLLWGGGTIWARIMFPKFVEYVRKVKPMAIVCTHITAANVAVSARMLTRQMFPIVCVPTDYEVEGLWPHKYTDLWCVANEHMAETLRPRKVPENRILITGIPASPAFRNTYESAPVREKLGVPEGKQMVLMQAGATLPRPYVHFRSMLRELMPFVHNLKNMHLVIVAGKDHDYAEEVRRQIKDYGLDNVTVLEYVDNMAELMGAADLVVCKPGGLTVTECLCAGSPMILTCRAYGQEKANVQMLTATGAALHVVTPRELYDALKLVDAHPQATEALLVNASFLRRPNAAMDIACATLRLAENLDENQPHLHKKHLMHFYWGKKPAHIR